MKRKLMVGLFVLWLGLRPGVLPAQTQTETTNAGASRPAASRLVSAAELKPGPNDSLIAQLTARLLERYHYSRQRLDTALSSRFLDGYIKDLDGQRLYFLQSDLKDFEAYRNRLIEGILDRNGDTSPAYVIFARFLQQLERRMEYSTGLLKQEKFDFTGADRVVINRKDLPFPKDLDQAKQLWRERVRYEYLSEKLNQPDPDDIAQRLLDRLTQTKPDRILASIRASQAQKAAATARGSSPTNATPATAGARVENDITSALQGKLNTERADAIAALVLEQLPKEKPEAIARAVRERVAADNAALIVDTLTRRYARILKTSKDWDSENVLEIYLTSLAHVFDPHSDYLGKSALENFAISMNLSLFGIGAQLQSDDSGYCKIMQLLPGPAKASKQIKANDKIVAVAQGTNEPVDIIDMPLNKAVNLIRGPKGTEVRLTIAPADTPSTRKIVSLTRDEIKLEDQEAKAKIVELPAPAGGHLRLGVIDLPSFYSTMDLGVSRGENTRRSTTDDVKKLLKDLETKDVSGVILDLRRNGGGSLEEAIQLTGLFIKKGPVVQVKDSSGQIAVDEDTDPSVAYDGPLILLTSRFSASASEIAAAALQDHGRALIVGDSSTHGKGTVQSLNSLKNLNISPAAWVGTNDPGAVKLTIRKFYRPSGLTTQLIGVTPDIVLPSVNNVADVGEKSLDNPLPPDTITNATFERLNRVEPYLPELRKRSAGRVARERSFDLIRDDIARYEKTQAEKTLSLNERERLKEKDEAEARAKARKLEAAAQPEPDQKVYDIRLERLDQPLPAPSQPTNTLASRLTLKTVTQQGPRLDFQFAASQGNDWVSRLDTNALSANLGLQVASRSSGGLELVITNAPWLGLGRAVPTAWPWGTNEIRTVVSAFGRVLAAALMPEAPATAAASPAVPDPEDFANPDDVPSMDVTLTEAEHILVDYLTLQPKNAIVTINESAPRPGAPRTLNETTTQSVR